MSGRGTHFRFARAHRLENITQYAYDASGNLTLATDANNRTTTYAYDAANRKVGRTPPLGMTETFGYDGDNNMTSHTDFRGKTSTYTFDARYPGRLVAKVPEPHLFQWSRVGEDRPVLNWQASCHAPPGLRLA